MFEQQAVGVQVKRQAAVGGDDIVQFRLVLHRRQVAPLVKDVHICAARLRVVLSQGDFAGMRPNPQLLLFQRQFQAQMVQFWLLATAAHALAAADLVGKTPATT